MTHTTPERESDEERLNGEAWEETREADAVPVSAEQFRITDIQHWIDLSA